MFKAVLVLSLSLLASPSFAADSEYFTLTGSPVARTLSLALAEWAKKVPAAVVAENGTLTVRDEKGAVGVRCEAAAKATCAFHQDLNNHYNDKPVVDQTIFDALLNLSTIDGETSDWFVLEVRRNRNRTFVALQPTLTFDWDVTHGIKCNATPKRGGGGFEYARCDFHVPRALSGEAATELLAKLQANSDVQARLATLTEANGWKLNPAKAKLYEFVDYRRYGWKELHLDFVNQKRPFENGDVADVFMQLLINSVRGDGRVLVERVKEYHNHTFRRRLR